MNGPGEQKRLVRLVISMGDPCGIGPEVCLRALASEEIAPDTALTAVGSLRVLEETARRIGAEPPGEAAVLDLDNFPKAMLSEHRPTAEGGEASLEYIERAVQEVMAGRADAVVTCPISKEAIGAAGSPYAGHTELLGALTGAERPVMLLLKGALRVALATTHLALRDVPEALTVEGIAHTGKVLGDALGRYFAVAHPRIAVCALNPHAGDGGRFGDEEERIIAPASAQIRENGFAVSGPLPADTLFAKALADRFDGVVAMYHDQGMIPVKLSGLAEVVNVTLGLPIVRTSPGHGTAYDIAGRGVAEESSTVEAIRTAAAMVRALVEGRSQSR